MNETLVCTTCDQSFTRKVVRGRKPKQCPACKVAAVTGVQPVDAPELVYKAADPVPVVLHTLDATTLERRGEALVYPEIEIAETANEDVIPGGKSYDSVIIDGIPFKAGDIVHIEDDGGRYTFKSLTVRMSGYVYVNLVGVSGSYDGKWRSVDPQRIVP